MNGRTAPQPRHRRPEFGQQTRGAARGLLAALLFIGLLGSPAPVWGQTPAPRVGKVLLVRGVMTVFSLGFDDLRDKLRQYGVDVEVVPASLSPIVVESIKADYRRDPHQTPIVIIGHSLGGTLAPSLARQLLVAGIPVELMIVVDSRHEITIPGNVRRCVNLYQPAKHGFVRGLPVSAESESTALFNVDVTRYENRAGGEIIDHFNIDESSWMHKVIIREVLRVCPKRAEVAKRK